MFRVLVVDDDPDIRELARDAMDSCRIACDVASDGDQAWKRFQQSPYEAVVTDLRMPRRHGHSLAVELLGLPNPPHLLVVTGLAEPRLVRDMMIRGVSDVVFKPVCYDVLAMKIIGLAAKSGRGGDWPGFAAGLSPLEHLRTIEASLAESWKDHGDVLRPIFEVSQDLSPPPRAVNDFIKRLLKEEDSADQDDWAGECKRSSPRAYSKVTATAVPLTEQLTLVGEPFRVALRDVSEGGVRLLHTRSIACSHLALRWTPETDPAGQLEVVGRVTRCEPLGPFYDIGCRFLSASALAYFGQERPFLE